MQKFCDLEVNVNGEETFFVHKNVLAGFSGRLRKLFSEVKGETRRLKLKVVFSDFPGGAEGFEMIAKFCYNGGFVDLTRSDVFLLHCAGNYMEMMSLVEQTNVYFSRIQCMSWSELVSGLKKCQELPCFLISPSLLQRFLDCVVSRLFMTSRLSSSDKSNILFSGEISVDSSKSCGQETNWWFQDLEFLNIGMLEKVVGTMVSHGLDHSVISSFLFRYKKSNFSSSAPALKCRIIEAVINLLSQLNRSFVSVRGIFDIFQASRGLKISKSWSKNLENLIGSQLDRATIDDLLVPSRPEKRYAYDVDLILRLLRIFQAENSKCFVVYRLKKVANLIDRYIAEVAPDQCLQPGKFVALATALPDIARDSNESLFEAIDVYFKVHSDLSAEEKTKIRFALNYNENSIKHLRGIRTEQDNGYDHVLASKIEKICLRNEGKIKLRSSLQNSRRLQMDVGNNFASMHKLCA